MILFDFYYKLLLKFCKRVQIYKFAFLKTADRI